MVKDRSKIIESYFLEYFESDFYQKENLSAYYSVFTGYAGVLLLYAEYYKLYRNEEIREKINEVVSLSIDKIDSSEKINPSYCTGLAGFAMLLIYLNESKLIESDEDLFVSIDEFLEAGIDYFLAIQNIDILHGAMGIALYFLKRKNLSVITKMIGYIDHNLEYFDFSATWRKLSATSNNEYRYDYSLSHGNASILYFAAKCFSCGYKNEQCNRIIKNLIKFFQHNIQNMDITGSFFPGHLLEKEFKSAERNNMFSRMAWCYGDLGILHTILLVSKWIDDNELFEWVVDRLKDTTTRKNPKQTLCQDAGFCHGSAGIAYIYRNAFKISNIKMFEEAEEYWLKETVLYGNTQDKMTCGYLFVAKEGLIPNYELLEGLVGVALVLLEASNDSGSEWNSFFFLS